MPITGQGWEFHVRRRTEQRRGDEIRTVGTYQVYHNGEPVSGISVGGVEVPLFGTTAEPKGPGQNDRPGTSRNPSRISAGRYPLKTSGGPTYVTNGYRTDLLIRRKMPGVELRRTGNRSDIIIHPGKNAFISSTGCINPCTSLPGADENIDYPGSRRRVIALIEDMRRFLGSVPGEGDKPIVNAFAVIDGEPGVRGGELIDRLADVGETIDGRAVAAANDVGVKNDNVRISELHPSMARAIVEVAASARALRLPRPVITSGNDSGHKPGSLHYRGRALDFRGNNISVQRGRAFAGDVAARVGGDYDVLFESFADPANNHLHIEFDPD